MLAVIKRYGNQYLFNDDNSILGVKNRTLGLLLRKVKVFANGSKTYTMEQKSLVKKFLVDLLYAFYRPQMYPPFWIYANQVVIGKSEISWNKGGQFRLHMDGCEYSLNLHCNNYMSVFKDNIQVALVKKSDMSYFNQDEYTVLCEKFFEESKPLLMLLVICLDIAFWSERIRWNGLRWEKTIGKEIHSEYVDWKPLS